ncbi:MULTISPECIES: OmpA family protein [Sphingomonadales]|uniref:OmpA-like domain-containing protein n=2 Tax=Edaphosphingomonas TaxID=3423724 RepID=A0A2T4HR62_9SPHN|nr:MULTISPECIES: OmpA family protein [Sphingomonas]AGH48479.1 hypothetical protein G432_03760 [Sphingomonas sp. MM-1]MDX3883340.1 OmpA family protein [Sphingomonas sp.]OHT20956.1 putative lipoprotein YiaD precursor [Sphingomonas haloaromaticamans]PTD18266.1 hypothetical protein CV103_15220 [Sphingomonas fennica]
MTNLVQMVIGAVSPDLISRISGSFGESPETTTKGLAAVIPTLFAGALQQSSAPGGAARITDLVSQSLSGGNPLDNIGALVGDDTARGSLLNQGGPMVASLLGGNGSGIANMLASLVGAKSGSISSLLALAAPLVMGAIGKSTGPNPSPSAVKGLLEDQRSNITGALPAGIGSLLGLGGGAAAQAAHVVDHGAEAAAGGLRKLWPLLLVALALIALLFGMKSCNRKAPEAAPPVASTAAVETLTLPGGGTISVAPGTIGHSLAKFLESSEPAPKTFVFDNLNFDTASDALTPESQATVNTLVAILKAYPNVNAGVVGYTDNTGDPAANKALSLKRATTVAQSMIAGGIDAARLQTGGMGEANPIADNGTEEGRAKNRRTELVVTKK